MKVILTFICVFFLKIAQGQKSVSYDTIIPLEPYNYILGTNAIGGNYQFTNDSKLLEQAKQIRGMGSNILKISLGKNYHQTYPDIKADASVKTTVDILKTQKDFRKVIDMDFKYISLIN